MNRSLAGNENEKHLSILKKNSPIKLKFLSGDKVFNWKIQRVEIKMVY